MRGVAERDKHSRRGTVGAGGWENRSRNLYSQQGSRADSGSVTVTGRETLRERDVAAGKPRNITQDPVTRSHSVPDGTPWVAMTRVFRATTGAATIVGNDFGMPGLGGHDDPWVSNPTMVGNDQERKPGPPWAGAVAMTEESR